MNPEWQEDGIFENHDTQIVMTSRPESDQQFTKTLQDDLLIIDTPALQPAYGMRPLSKEGLSVVVKGPAPSQMNTYALR